MFVRFKYYYRLTNSNLLTPPATVVIKNSPNSVNKGASYKLSSKWLSWIEDNNGYQEARYLLKEHSGWVNLHAGDGTPISESLSMGGNIAAVERIEGNYAKLYALNPSAPIPDKNDHLRVHKFTSVTVTGQPRLAGAGLHCYFPFIINGEAWVSLNLVDLFTSMPEPMWPGGLPVDLAGYPAIIKPGSPVFQRPGEVKLFVTTGELAVRVISEVNGWAKFGDKRWVDVDQLI